MSSPRYCAGVRRYCCSAPGNHAFLSPLPAAYPLSVEDLKLGSDAGLGFPVATGRLALPDYFFYLLPAEPAGHGLNIVKVVFVCVLPLGPVSVFLIVFFICTAEVRISMAASGSQQQLGLGALPLS